MFSVNLREDIKDTFWRECGNIEFRYISSVVLEDFLRYMITRHFRSYGYKDEGKMYHFALARSTRREKKDLRFDCDECSFFRLYHIKCEESKSRFWNIVLWGEKKRYYTFNPFFAVLWIYQKCHYDLRLPRIVAAFITQLVGTPRSWQTCRSLARLCVHFHPSLKKNVCIPLRTCVRQKEVTSVFSCWTWWELDESLISLRTGYWKWCVPMHTFVPSDENVTLFFSARRYIRSWNLKPTFLI